MTMRSTIDSSTISCGLYSSKYIWRKAVKVFQSSPGSTASRQNSPCVTPFMLERFLPAAVLGPVDFFALARLAASFFSVTVMAVAPFPAGSGRDV